MMAELRATILGCGSSGGVPRLGGDWGNCDPANPRNIRRRCSLLLERVSDTGRTQVLIDTSPDMRAQLLDAGVGRLDAVVFTHSHADHVHGIDDLRQIVFNTRERLPVWADGPTQEALYSRFGYAFIQPAGSPYPPILDMHTIDGAITIKGAGGPLTLHPLRLNHGSIDALGFRVGGLAYTPDVVMIYPESWQMLQGLDLWIVDALRRKPHPTHAHLDMTLDWIAQAKPARAVLTNMHNDMDYATITAETPEHVTPAHDGMVLTLPL
ncbi:phosphoribosyl 1,2-cyclic phosphate phosphodiesterase [Roseinatronobacter bogoriensis subsp. barguzinensis]|nr:phosphoribosyl 1,2-cyclic phosphate phosphodiesterase [Rhodobaca bogoriensis DSM 18756]TDW39914.1 phosphoribosyl 1,2-cyclic phosphate phosphodiesterase [Rhodobaca barguzinensis]TDY70933.1 phosphoribosyl 1,2-cyclic phosphate phosphodiesterase [Rhodobaca bogoriensis DSM 18756]